MNTKKLIIIFVSVSILTISLSLAIGKYAMKMYRLTNELQSCQVQNEYLMDLVKPNLVQERYKDYTNVDFVILNEILAELIEPTAGHYIRLDINNDGLLNILDSVKLHRILSGLE